MSSDTINGEKGGAGRGARDAIALRFPAIIVPCGPDGLVTAEGTFGARRIGPGLGGSVELGHETRTASPGATHAAVLLPAEFDPESGLAFPTLADVHRAKAAIASRLHPTPLLRSALLDERLGFACYLKAESLLPTGAFKIRGGLFLMDELTSGERARGVITASTGNHGQSIAYAAREYSVSARVFAPLGANPLKVAAMERFGAEVVLAGLDFDESRALAEADAADSGRFFVHSMNEPRLIAGVATYTLEILDEVPDLDVILVPLGGGSGVSGACIVGKALRPDLRVIAVQASGAAAFHDSWKAGKRVTHPSVDTFAEGLATRDAASLTLAITRRYLDDFRLVSDAEMRRTILTLLETTRLLAEGAGAAALAAAYAMREDMAGQKVAVVLSGGNLTLDALAEALATEQPW